MGEKDKLRLKCLVPCLIFLAMFFASTAAREIDSLHDPPCYFNPLCSCSKAVPDLGIVRCQNTLLFRIPTQINSSKAFMLHMDNIGLRTIEPHFLQSTGLYKISITRNPLYVIADDAFVGLERTLWRLDLSNNKLLNIPSKAIRNLQKLRFLDLTGNDITYIFSDSWKGPENSLETLILADNSIAHLPSDAFTGLPFLDTINLKGNNLREIDPSVFREGMNRLSHVILADNQLQFIPYTALFPLKMLKTLDLSYNRINKMFASLESGNINIQLDIRMSLDTIDLSYNQLTVLESSSFQYFDVLNKSYLDGNPLTKMEDNAFQYAKISELYIRNCELTQVSPASFYGLENYLRILDLSGNNITNIQEDFIPTFKFLRYFSISDNLLKSFNSVESTDDFQYKLLHLDLSGARNHPIQLENLKRLGNLRKLQLSRITQSSLRMDDLLEYGLNLEEFYLTFSDLKSVKDRAFRGVRGLKLLDLSENRINKIENEAFVDIRHSLLCLRLSHAFASSVSILPVEPLNFLLNLKHLDISNNKIKTIPNNSFHFLKKLKIVELQDNEIEHLEQGTFQDIHSNLEIIYLSFNKLKLIDGNSFVNLDMLEQLYLDDNSITTLEKGGFMDLENLKRLNLKGNKISTISYETFQNLPELEDLDLSYNELTDFQFSIMDQVGILATFRVNVSHNKLFNLSENIHLESEYGPEAFHSDIKILDLSYNNISYTISRYFQPVESSLTHLYLSHNALFNIDASVIGNMPHLQWLDLSFNKLLELEYNTFQNTRNIQILLLSHNYIAEFPKDIFRNSFKLRMVDLSFNRFRFLPDNLFKEGLERIDVSNNQLTRLPLSSFSDGAASTLSELDLSWNHISTMGSEDMFAKFESLLSLDLSNNNLIQIDAGVFCSLSKLIDLDLSYNYQLFFDKDGKSFQGIEDTLMSLKLKNLSLTTFPVLPLPNLVSLSVSQNYLPTISQEMVVNLTNIRRLDLSENVITIVPIMLHSLRDLKNISLASNPISTLTNTSLLGVVNHLEELDITDLPLQEFEIGALNKLIFLRTLKIGTYGMIKNFNIPSVTACNFGLRILEIEVKQGTDLGKEMQGNLPIKLRRLTITGPALTTLNSDILEGIRSPTLHFELHNTSLAHVPIELFNDVHWLKNVTLDLRDNSKLQTFGNPIKAEKPGLTRKNFLLDVYMEKNKWQCDCGLSWIEIWLRKRRQYLCNFNLYSLPSQQSPLYNCRHVGDDIRNSVCVNKANNSLIEVFKTEIECDWNSGSSNNAFTVTFILVIVECLRYW